MNKDNKVAILMSTYNGEKYLSEQIESIIKQTYDNWELFIRDDGSDDKTQEIIRYYSESFGNIHFINDNNIQNKGVVGSFMELLQSVKADYYMFSDQDDYWKSEKVQKTLKLMLSEKDQSVPLCVHTDLQIVNKDLQSDGLMNGSFVWHSFLYLMFSNCVTGCTMMINDPLKKMIDFKQVNQIYMHDWWIALIASVFGKILYLNEPTILYRQHEGNVVGEAEKSKLKRFFNRQMDVENMLNVFSISNKFKCVYGENLDGIVKEYTYAYGNAISKSSFINNVKLLLHYPPKRMTLIGKLFFSYLVVTHCRQIKQLK